MSPVNAKPVILVIDDDPASLALIEVILKRQNCDVMTSRSAIEGLRLIHLHRPTLVILDDIMPDQHGGDLCYALKQDPIYSQIPVILFSAGMRVRDPAYLKQTGADSALLKPFLPQELVKAIESVLHRAVLI
jgi:DNA-binding response OmpR family regulator